MSTQADPETPIRRLAREGCPICKGLGVLPTVVYTAIDGANEQTNKPCYECERVEAALLQAEERLQSFLASVEDLKRGLR